MMGPASIDRIITVVYFAGVSAIALSSYSAGRGHERPEGQVLGGRNVGWFVVVRRCSCRTSARSLIGLPGTRTEDQSQTLVTPSGTTAVSSPVGPVRLGGGTQATENGIDAGACRVGGGKPHLGAPTREQVSGLTYATAEQPVLVASRHDSRSPERDSAEGRVELRGGARGHPRAHGPAGMASA